MKKKSVALFIVILLIITMFPAVSLADSGTISAGGEYDLRLYGDSSTVTISTPEAVTLTGGGAEYKNLKIVCSGKTNLTLKNVVITNNEVLKCALSFSGKDNVLSLIGTNTLKGGRHEAGVLVGKDASLTISGTGTLNAMGGMYGAGIGGGYGNTTGAIIISGATVNAKGGEGAAGIGAGLSGKNSWSSISESVVTATGGEGGAGIGGGKDSYNTAGSIEIYSGTVTARGGDGAAGIGGGFSNSNSSVYIFGGTVLAAGGDYGAGIGGGQNGSGGYIFINAGVVNAEGGAGSAGIGGGMDASGRKIYISGGTVNARSGSFAAGIGGGQHGSAGSIDIHGGTIMATCDNCGPGLGAGDGGEGGSAVISGGYVYVSGDYLTDINFGYRQYKNLTIFGNAAVLCKNRSYMKAATETHTCYEKYDMAASVDGKVFGIALPDGWPSQICAYIVPTTLTYDLDGGKGKAEKVVQHIGTQVTLSDGSGLSKGKFFVQDWKMMTDEYPYPYYDLGSKLTLLKDATLRAEWRLARVTAVLLSSNAQTLTTGDKVALTADVSPANASYPEVYWTSSNNMVAAVSRDGIITALSAGDAVITAYADSVSATCAVTVKKQVPAVTLSDQTKALTVDGTAELTAVVSDGTAVTWQSSNERVAVVDENGVVTGVGVGKAFITAAVKGGSAVCEVYVSDVIMNLSAIVGQTINLSAATSGGGSQITWTSSDTGVATVNGRGIVTAVGEGSALITLTSGSVSHSVGILVDNAAAAPADDTD